MEFFFVIIKFLFFYEFSQKQLSEFLLQKHLMQGYQYLKNE